MLAKLYRKYQQDNNLQDLVRHSGMLYAGGLISVVLALAQQLTTAYFLGNEGYGLVAIIVTSATGFAMLMDFRTWEISAKLISKSMHQNDTQETVRVINHLIGIELLTGVVAAVGMIICAPFIATTLLKQPELENLVKLFALSLPIRVLSIGVIATLPRLYNRFFLLTCKSIAYAVFRLVLMTGAAYLGLGVEGVIIGALIGEILNIGLLLFIFALIFRVHLSEAKMLDFARPKQMNDIVGSLGKYWINSTLIALYHYTFIPISALYTSPAQIGLLRRGLDIAELITRTMQPLTIVFSPKIISLYETGDITAFRRYIKQCVLLLCIVIAPVTFGLLLFGPFVLGNILQVEDAFAVSSVANILIVGFAIYSISIWWLLPSLVATNQVTAHNVVLFVLVTISTAGLMIYVPVYGVIGAALIRTLFFFCYGFVVLMIFLQGQLKINQQRAVVNSTAMD